MTAALWLYARVRAPPTSAAEGCEVREIWKGSWTSIGSTSTWSLVRSFIVVSEAREGGRRGRARVAARIAVRGQEEPRLWESRAGDDLVDALLDGDREGAHPVRLDRAPSTPVVGARANERVDERLRTRVNAASRLNRERDEEGAGARGSDSGAVVVHLPHGSLGSPSRASRTSPR